MINPQDIVKTAEGIAAGILAAKIYLGAIKNDLGDVCIRELDTLAAKYTAFFSEKMNGAENDHSQQKEQSIDIPLNFQHENKKPRIVPNDASINPLNYLSYYGDNLITPYAISIVNLICAYQNDKKNRYISTIKSIMPGHSRSFTLWDSRDSSVIF